MSRIARKLPAIGRQGALIPAYPSPVSSLVAGEMAQRRALIRRRSPYAPFAKPGNANCGGALMTRRRRRVIRDAVLAVVIALECRG